MMGFGPFSHGSYSSSSSSNLSPLAQPFAVDRSLPNPNPNPNPNHNPNHNPNNLNTLVPLGSEDPYSYSFRPSFDNWLHLHPPTSVPDPFSKPSSSYSELLLDSTHAATNLSCASNNNYVGNYYGSHSISSSGTPHFKPNPAAAAAAATSNNIIGSFPPYDHLRQSESIGTTNLVKKAKPYYPQNPSSIPAIMHDDSSNPVVLNHSGCDILSPTSSFTPLEDGTYQTGGYLPPPPRNFSLGYYTAQWSSGFYDGVPDDEEQEARRKGLDGNSFGNGNHHRSTDLMTDTSFLNKGTPAPEGMTAKRVDSSARRRISGSTGIGWDNRCSLLLEDTARVSPFKSSRAGVSGPASMLQEAHHPQAPSPASFMKTWSSLFPDSASHEGCFTQLDSCTNDPAVSYASVTSSPSTLVFGARTSGTSSSALETSPSRNVNFAQQSGDAFDSDESADCITSKIKEPLFQMSLKDKLKAKSELQANYFKLSDAPNIVSGGSGTANSAERSSGTYDLFNPVVDSPCWKGALSCRQSPFEVAEMVSPYLPVKEFVGSNSSNLEWPHILAVYADDAVAVSSQKEGGDLVPDGNEHGEDGSSSLFKRFSSVANFPSVEDELKNSVKASPYHSKVNIENEILCSDYIQEPSLPRKEPDPSIYSKRSSELKPSHMKQMSYGNNITSAELFNSEATVVNSGMDIKDLTQDGSSSVQFNAVEHASSMPFCLASVPVGLAKKIGGACDTGPKIDIQLLVNAMHNLSELFLSSSIEGEALKEQDQEVIRCVINNLDAFLSKKAGLMRSMPQSQFPESSTCCLRNPTDPQKVSGTCRSQVNSVEAVNVPSQHDLEGKMHFTDSGKQGNKLQDYASMDGETGVEIDNDMTQAIKKIMEEKFDIEEKHLQTILFKNLWLEAEAALCSVKYKARYARLKIEMENCKQDQEKDVAGKTIDKGRNLSPTVSRDPSVDDMLTQDMEESTVLETTTQEINPTGIASQVEDAEALVTSQGEDAEASVASQAEDIEASVMSRFHILKCRVDNFNSMNKGHPAELTGIGAYAGREETISSMCPSGTQNIRTKTQPIKVVDGDSSEKRNSSPFIRDRSEDERLEVIIRLAMQHHGSNCTEEKTELDSDVPGQHDPLKEFGVCISEEPVDTLIPNKDGNQCVGGGFDSPSSDWEHVLKEELKWQN